MTITAIIDFNKIDSFVLSIVVITTAVLSCNTSTTTMTNLTIMWCSLDLVAQLRFGHSCSRARFQHAAGHPHL